MQRVESTASELNDFTEGEDGRKVYYVSKSRLLGLIDWLNVVNAYTPIFLWVVVAALVVEIATTLPLYGYNLQHLLEGELHLHISFVGSQVLANKASALPYLGAQFLVVALLFVWNFVQLRNTVYLLDFETFEPPDNWKCSPDQILEAMRRQDCFTEESLQFMGRMVNQSGVGPRTAWPPGIVQSLEGKPTERSTEASREEAKTVIFTIVRELLKKTKINPKDIDILVINCSLFSPTPSLCAMVINEFKMKQGISSYNLSGMGCAAGLISVELVKNVLAAKPNSTALIVSTEIITPNLYHGNDRAFLLQNTLFRCGGAAMILTNKWSAAFQARFKLLHVIRTIYIAEESMGCVYETEDEIAHQGVRLSKDIVKVAGRAMEKNLTTLGPYVLPIREQAKTAFWIVVRELFKRLKSMFGLQLPKINPYIPDFKRGIDHFCIHAGGRAVIDGIEKNLQLHPHHVEASRHTLYTYGNTSSSSIWYEMKYVCNHLGITRGQRVLQLAFGSGFKCNSAVWLALQSSKKVPVERAAKPKNE